MVEVKALVGDEYEVIGKYVNTREKVRMRHGKCGYKYDANPRDVLKGSRCPKCSGLMKKTPETFKKEVFALTGDEYEVIGKYSNSRTKIPMKHTNCGLIYEVKPNDFLNGRRCPKCFGKMKKSTDVFRKEVFELVGDEYSVSSEYINNKTKIKMVHEICSFEYDVVPSSFLRGIRCPKCSGKMKKTTEQYKKEVYDLVGDEYEILGEYKNAITKIKTKHENCGNIYSVKPSGFLSGDRCPKCGGSLKKTDEIYKKEIFDLVGNEYEAITAYINNRTKIEMKHNVCGYVYNVKPNVFLSGCRCPWCFGSVKKTTEQFKEDVYDLVEGEYEVLGEYKNSKDKILMRHSTDECIYEYKVTPNDFLRGRRCPQCKESKGEKDIKIYLDTKKINFSPQYRFDDCRNKYPLPFDFAVFNEDKTLNCLIEYDGQQHYKSFIFFGGMEKLKQTQKHDQIKTQYCKDNNIKLIRIPYWDFDNIETILNEELKDLINNSEDEVSA